MPDKRDLIRTIAAERIDLLFGLAEKTVGSNEPLSKRYVKELLRIGAHYKVSVRKNLKRLICTRCNLVLVPGYNCLVRVVSSRGYVAYKCSSCGREVHVPY